jgi:hypothetical protein
LLTATLENDRHRFCDLISAIVRQSLTWRKGKGNALTREEVQKLNSAILGLGFKIPDLWDAKFLAGLSSTTPAPLSPNSDAPKIDREKAQSLATALLSLSSMPPQPRGFAFEKFLKEAFALYGLSPRASFRIVGEQIDGSFQIAEDTYLLEAKWQSEQITANDLYAFAGKVGGKAAWSRGLFLSYSGFSEDGLVAFGRGGPTPIICMDGRDLHEMLASAFSLRDVITRKVRRAAETGAALTRIRDLFGT